MNKPKSPKTLTPSTSSVLHLTVYTVLGVLAVMIWHSSICVGQREEILLLTIPSKSRVQNLVLYLYTPADGDSVIERAAITEGSRKILGDEAQELVDLRGSPFNREHFMLKENWARDINFDGYPDLIVATSKGPHRGSASSSFLYLYDPTIRGFRRDVEQVYALEPQLFYSRGDS